MSDRGGWAGAWWRRAHLVASAGVLAFSVGYVINGRRSEDVYLHASVIRRMAQDLWSPSNPMVATDATDVGYSPYALVLALVTRLTGWSPFTVLDLAGIALVLTFLALLPSAVEVLTGDRRASPLVLVLLLTAWGVQQPWRWSGYLSLNSFGFMVGYPSMAAWCGLLGAVVAARRAAGDRHSWGWALVGSLLLFVALVHPLTLVGAVPLVGGVLLRDGGVTVLRRGALVAALVVVGVVAWPYFSLLDLLRSGGEAYDIIHRPLYSGVLQRAGLGLLAVVALGWLCWRRPRTYSPLGATAAVAGGLFVWGGLTDRWTAGRALPFVLFAGVLAVGAATTTVLADGSRSWTRRVAVVVPLTGLVLVGAYGSRSGVVAGIPRDLVWIDHGELESEIHRFDHFAPHLDDGDVVVALDLTARKGVTALGASVLAPGFPSVHVDDLDARIRDTMLVLFGDAATRAQVIDRRGLTHAVLVAGEPVPGVDGAPVATSGRYELHRLT